QEAADNVVEIRVGHVHDANNERLTRLDEFGCPLRAVEQFNFQDFCASITVTIYPIQRNRLGLEQFVGVSGLIRWFRIGLVSLLARNDYSLIAIEHVSR